MASINYAAREISVKVVYYGPGLSGKTTNLQVIHKKVPPEYKSDMVSLATETDRTLFFDFLPLDLGKIKGFATKFQLYTVPGQVYYNATRKLVLRGVDGIVFVADSAPDKIQENLESFQNLEDNLAEYGYKRESIPIIIQYNKRDLPNALPVEELHKLINKYNLPWNEAVANKGKGVFDSLKLIGKIVIDYLNKKYSRQGRPAQAQPSAPAPESYSYQNTQQPRTADPRSPYQNPQSRQQQPAYQNPNQPQYQAGGFGSGYQQPRAQFPQQQQPVRPVAPQQQQAQRPQMPQMPPRQQQMPPAMQAPQGMPQRMSNPTPQQAPKPLQSRQNFQQQQFNTQQHIQQPMQSRPPISGQNMQQPEIKRPFIPPQQQPQQRNPFGNQQQGAFVEEDDNVFDVSAQQPMSSRQNFQSYEQNQTQNQYASDYYDYGNIPLQNMSDQESAQNAQHHAPMHEMQDLSEQMRPGSAAAQNLEVSGKTDLDLEIEKYQREIEEKQRRVRTQPQTQAAAPQYTQQGNFSQQQHYQQQQYQQPMQQPPLQQPMQQQQYAQQQPVEENDYDVYNIELSSYPAQNHPPTQRQPVVPADDGDDTMYFTSVDTDRQKRPIRRPVNPRTKQQQKGFLSKFFNKENP